MAKKQKLEEKLDDEIVESDLLSLKSEDEEITDDSVIEAEEEEQEEEEVEEQVVIEDDEEDEDEEESDEDESDEEEIELDDIDVDAEEGDEEPADDCGCEPEEDEGEADLLLGEPSDEEEEEDEDEESELAKARAEDGEVEEGVEEEDEDEDDVEETYEAVDYSKVKQLVEEEEGLTEAFKAKAALIFEAEVRTQVETIKEQLEEKYEHKLSESTEQYRETLSEQIDSYLSYAVEEWMEENKVAIESGLRTNIAEGFMSNLKTLFTESYIEVPESKVDLHSELEKEAAQLKEDLAKANHIAVFLSEKVDKLSREQVLEAATADLARTQAAKLTQLAEKVTFESVEDFTEKVDTLKKFYFKGEGKEAKELKEETETASTQRKRKPVVVSKETIVEGIQDEKAELPKSMQNYLSAITRLNRARGVN